VTTDSVGERGVLGIAFDPAFASNNFVYVYYTATSPTVHNRVSRFTANGDVAVPGSETVIVDLDDLSIASNHNGGAIHFGIDGKLYVATGENANGDNSQSFTTTLGKLLRFNKDGTIPSDNPFFGMTTGKNRAIWALGLRNPFTFAVQPGSGKIYINDVGQATWEEIDEGFAGANYGWPSEEGPSTNPAYRAPIHAYNHNGQSMAITGGAFYNPPTVQYPASYVGKYFFNEANNGLIRILDPADFSVTPWASGTSFPVDIKIGSDGIVYYVSRDRNELRRIRYVGGAGQAPVISQHPASITRGVGQSATFSVSASGSQPLAYQWQRNGSDIAGATASSYTIASVAASDNGATFRARVSNSLGTVTSNSATLTVTTNQAPTATITAPAMGAQYSGGQTISFAGDANDAEDGSLPASAYDWAVVFHHDTHTHPFLDSIPGVKSGSFVIPNRGETATNVWYRIHLTVRDSGGLVTTTFRDVTPRVSNLTVQSNPAGLQLTIDGMPVTAPATFGSVVGMIRSIGAPSPQTSGGNSYVFGAWSDGGAATHELAAPATNTTYTATFNPGGPVTTLYQINSGGGAVSPFAGDQSFTGGNTYASGAAVSTAGVANAAPAAVYQTERFGNFSYTLGALSPGASYTVRLHFAEVYWTAAGRRVFNVSINGAQVLSNYDIYANAGANKAVVRDFAANASAAGQVVVQFTTVADNAKVSGIELLAAGSGPPPDAGADASPPPPDAGADAAPPPPDAPMDTAPPPPDAAPDVAPPPPDMAPPADSGGGGTKVYQLNSGGGAVSPFAADQFSSGGNVYATGAAVSTAGVANAAPAAVYQTERFGNFTYSLGALASGTTYTVRLHFAEIYWTSSGQRRFNVAINGTQVLSNYDIYATVGANKAVVRDFPALANGAGQIIIQFTTVSDNAKVSGIELIR
jgi:hypothetical protein